MTKRSGRLNKSINANTLPTSNGEWCSNTNNNAKKSAEKELPKLNVTNT